MTSHTSCEANSAESKAGTHLVLARRLSMGRGRHCGLRTAVLQREKEQERDQQRKDAERFGDCEPENQVAELSLCGGWITRRGQVMTEDGAHADAGAAHSDAGNSGTDIFCCDWIHDEPCLIVIGSQWPGWMASLR